MKRSELVAVIKEVTLEAGFESEDEFAEEFAGDCVDRLEEQFSLIDEEEDEDEDEG